MLLQSPHQIFRLRNWKSCSPCPHQRERKINIRIDPRATKELLLTQGDGGGPGKGDCGQIREKAK